jgi:hypothetical protein
MLAGPCLEKIDEAAWRYAVKLKDPYFPQILNRLTERIGM